MLAQGALPMGCLRTATRQHSHSTPMGEGQNNAENGSFVQKKGAYHSSRKGRRDRETRPILRMSSASVGFRLLGRGFDFFHGVLADGSRCAKPRAARDRHYYYGREVQVPDAVERASPGWTVSQIVPNCPALSGGIFYVLFFLGCPTCGGACARSPFGPGRGNGTQRLATSRVLSGYYLFFCVFTPVLADCHHAHAQFGGGDSFVFQGHGLWSCSGGGKRPS
ncbi:MAG: hypothetical protein JWR26_4996 [Pedosphaera sp.]|nr:hypothetical protein [Pedosphaera sp.]